MDLASVFLLLNLPRKKETELGTISPIMTMINAGSGAKYPSLIMIPAPKHTRGPSISDNTRSMTYRYVTRRLIIDSRCIFLFFIISWSNVDIFHCCRFSQKRCCNMVFCILESHNKNSFTFHSATGCIHRKIKRPENLSNL